MEQGRSTSLRVSNKSTKLLPRDISESLGKLPPQALDLEEAVLGALMLEKSALNAVVEFLKPEHFYSEAHREIYSSIIQLFKGSEPVDMRTVVNQLRKDGKIELVGGAYYIAELTSKVSSAANIEYHARVVIEMAIKRDLIQIASQVHQDAYEDTTDVFELLDKTEQSIFAISDSNLRKNYDNMRNLMYRAIQELQKLKEHKDGLTGVPTGFSALDRATSGWQNSDLVIIAARPGMGKCLGKGTKVLMYDGSLKKVEDIVDGDKLMGDDSQPRTVLSIARGREKMYWIHQNHGISYRVNESHILSLKRSRNEGGHEHGEVLNIEVRDYLAKSDKFKSNYKGYKVAVEFDEKFLPIEPYFLGLWLGDGHSESSRITNTDPEVIEFMQSYSDHLELKLVEYKQEGRVSNYAITKGFRGGIDTYSLQGILRELGVLKNKHIPQAFLVNSTENRLSLLAGLLDSDGHYHPDYHVYEITQKNERLAQQIKFLCDTLGFKTSLKKKKATIADRDFETDVFRVRISGDVEKIPVKIERKKARQRISNIDWRHTGIEVAFDKVDDYYGFEIDGNRLFLLEDMTVTHNTAFVVSAMRNAAVDFKRPVAIFSLEMASVQLVNRMISAEAELEGEKIRKGQLADFEWQQLVHKTNRLSSAPIFIDDTPALSILELRAKCRRLKAEHNIQLVIVDYLQLMRGDSTGNREQEIASISRALKGIAKELEVPVLALSQLSRGVETRGGDKRPQLSDLRESGSIEQDADIVMFLYRPEYYKITVDEEGMPTQGMGEVIIAKHRNGSTGTVKLKFIGKYTKFADFDAPIVNDNPFSGMITRESRLNRPDDEPPAPGGDDMPF
ncbi:MAG TPA: replicative DNA helicase [Cyclobacteriaceae bacterium]|nr:replicative DNA helicase [Cyclobacteriaceae bacterium]